MNRRVRIGTTLLLGWLGLAASAGWGQEGATLRTLKDEFPLLTPQSRLNGVVARVGETVVTDRDLDLEWRWARQDNADLKAIPGPAERRSITKDIVSDLLWMQHAKTFPTYADVVTDEVVVDRIRAMTGDLWDTDLPDGTRALLRRRAEARIAQEALLLTDPNFQRAIEVLPHELRKQYRRLREQFVEKEQVQLGRVILPRAVVEDAEALIEQIRLRALDGVTLEEATAELAAGNYKVMDWEILENAGFRPEVHSFAAGGSIGDVSAMVPMRSSVQLFEIVDRRAERVAPFSEIAPRLAQQIRQDRFLQASVRFFVRKLIPEADFEPFSLFEEELGPALSADPGARGRRP